MLQSAEQFESWKELMVQTHFMPGRSPHDGKPYVTHLGGRPPSYPCMVATSQPSSATFYHSFFTAQEAEMLLGRQGDEPGGQANENQH